MNTTTILEHHLEISEQVHKLLLDENTLLKQREEVPDHDFLERKQEMLEELSRSLDAVKQMQSSQSVFSDTEKEMIRTAQNRTMQGLYLDRENEQLLLKHSVNPRTPEMKRAVTEERLKVAYGKQTD
ncbi:MAG: hypothetical protein AAGB06_01710 [Verrucomicrobiota bacterium]